MARALLAAASGRRRGGGAPPTFDFTPLPTQPAGFAYSTTPGITASDWSHPGALVITGQDNYDHATFHTISAAGGTVLLYIDCLIDNTTGHYQGLLINSNSYGSAVPDWPGPISANSSGNLLDFRTTSTMHADSTSHPGWTKLEAVLEQMVTDNPHMAGFFADDLGSRSWFPNFDWTTWTSTAQGQYRAGAIAVAQTFRRVCDRHGLLFIVNGTWEGGTLAASGGGYPLMGTDGTDGGLSLADGGTWEHHDYGAFGAAYVAASQWATAALGGAAMNIVIANSPTEVTTWKTNAPTAYISDQTSSDGYGGKAPWGTFHDAGLPSHAS